MEERGDGCNVLDTKSVTLHLGRSCTCTCSPYSTSLLNMCDTDAEYRRTARKMAPGDLSFRMNETLLISPFDFNVRTIESI